MHSATRLLSDEGVEVGRPASGHVGLIALLGGLAAMALLSACSQANDGAKAPTATSDRAPSALAQPGQVASRAPSPTPEEAGPKSPSSGATASPLEYASHLLAGPPKIAHAIEGKEGKCLGCHGRGAMAPYPVGHSGRWVESCVRCHESSPAPAPRIRHSVADRAGKCLICHGSSGGASRIPRDHGTRNVSSCEVCHRGS